MAAGGRPLGTPTVPQPPPPPKSPNHNKRRGGGGRGANNRALVALLLAACAFSAATLLVASPSVARNLASLDDSLGMGAKAAGAAGGGGEGGSGNRPGEGAGNEGAAGGANVEKDTGEGDEGDEGDEDDPPRSTTADLVSWILSANDRDAGTQHAALRRWDDSPAVPLQFVPGTLSLTHVQALQHCLAPPEVYRRHFQGGRGDGRNVRVSYSEKHKLAYVMLPKSGSSTARHMMKEKFHATERNKDLRPRAYGEGGGMEGVEVVTFVRGK